MATITPSVRSFPAPMCMLLFIMLTTTLTVSATDFITEVKLIGGPTLENDVNPLWDDLINNQG